MFRLANLAGFEAAQAYAGLVGVTSAKIFDPAVLLGVLTLWVAAPLTAALWVFNRRRA